MSQNLENILEEAAETEEATMKSKIEELRRGGIEIALRHGKYNPLTNIKTLKGM